MSDLPDASDADIERTARMLARFATPKKPDPLKIWQKNYATWLVLNDRRNRQGRLNEARKFSRGHVSRASLSELERREDFKAYCASLLESGLAAARAKLELIYPKAVDMHQEGMQMAFDAEDYKAIPAYTVPLLDRIAPKNDKAIVATQITISLTPKQEALLDAPFIEVEGERIEDDDAV